MMVKNHVDIQLGYTTQSAEAPAIPTEASTHGCTFDFC